MKILLNYTVKLGKYDGNDDVFEREVDVNDAEVEKAFKMAVMTGEDFDEVPELQNLCDEVYREIEQQENAKLREEGDDAFALQCFEKGESPFDHGYKIEVFFPYEEIVPEDGEIAEYLREALTAGDVELAEEIVLEQNGNYSGNLIEKVFELAAETGCQEFIDKNKQN